MPGIGELMEGAMQQAPQPARHFMATDLVGEKRQGGRFYSPAHFLGIVRNGAAATLTQGGQAKRNPTPDRGLNA
jgi:hypothetical protein